MNSEENNQQRITENIITIKEEREDNDVSQSTKTISREIFEHQPQPSTSNINHQPIYRNDEDLKPSTIIWNGHIGNYPSMTNEEDESDMSDGTIDISESYDDYEKNDNNGAKSTDEEDDDQYIDCEEEETDTKPHDISGHFSSDEESEKCVICLSRFLGQTIGTPEVCNHNFCLECIEEWSRQVSACPVDRKIYSTILARKEIDGQVIQKINVSAENQTRPAYDDVAPDDVTYCEVCGRCDREDRLLLCDGCDFGFHLECLNPPLEHVPIEDWYCPDCNRVNVNPTRQNTNLLNMIAHGISSEYSLIQRYRRRRMNPEGISEVVRKRINERRRTRGNDDHLTSSMSSSASSRVVYSAYSDRPTNITTSVPKKIKQTKSEKKQSTKKTTKRKSTKRKTTKRKGRKGSKRSRRTKRRRKKISRRATVNLKSDSIRERIARKLGLKNLQKTPFGLPVFRKAQNQSGCLVKSKNDLTTQRENAGIAQISLCGAEQTHIQPVSDPELYVNEHTNPNDEIEYEHDVGSGAAAIAAMTRRRMTPACAARILAKKASTLRAPVSNLLLSNNRLNQRDKILNSQSSNSDLLGSILSSQTVLLSNSDQSYITREGDLRLRCQPSSVSYLSLNSDSFLNLVRTHNDNQQVGHREKTTSKNSVPDASSQSVSNSNIAANANHEIPTSTDRTGSGLSSVGISSSLHHQVWNTTRNDKSTTPTPRDFVISKPSPQKVKEHLEDDDEIALDLTDPTKSEVDQGGGRSNEYTEANISGNDDQTESNAGTQSLAENSKEGESSESECKQKLISSSDLSVKEAANLTAPKDISDQSVDLKFKDISKRDTEKLAEKTLRKYSEDSAKRPDSSIFDHCIVSSDVQGDRLTGEGEKADKDLGHRTSNINHPSSSSLISTNGNAISKESFQNPTHAATCVKVKRCRHGRIIVLNKDKSKKKDAPVASDGSDIINKEHHSGSKLCHIDLSTRTKSPAQEEESKQIHLPKNSADRSKNEEPDPHETIEVEAKSLADDMFSNDATLSEHKSKSKKDKKKHHRRSYSRDKDRDRIISKSRSRSRSRNRSRVTSHQRSRSGTRKNHHRNKSRSRSPRSSRKHRRRSRSNSRARHRERDIDRKPRKDINFRAIEYSSSEEYYNKRKRIRKSPVFDDDSNRKSEYRREEGNCSYSRISNVASTSHQYSPFDKGSRRLYQEIKRSSARSVGDKNDKYEINLDSESSINKKVSKRSSLAQDDLEISCPSQKSLKDSMAGLNYSSMGNVSVAPIHSETEENDLAREAIAKTELIIQKNPERKKLMSIEPFTIGKRRILEPFDPSESGTEQSPARKLFAALNDEYENAPAKPSSQDYLSRFLPKLGETSLSNMDLHRGRINTDSEDMFNPPTGSSKNNLIPLSPTNNGQSRRADSVQSLPTPIQDESNAGDLQRKYRNPERPEGIMGRHDMSSPDSSIRSNSDIYDPEAPLGPISPSDSPLLSPFAQSAGKISTNVNSLETASLMEQLRKMQSRQDGGDGGNKSMFDTVTNLLNSLAETNPNFLDTINKLTGQVTRSEEGSSRKSSDAMLNKICAQLSSQSTSSQGAGVAKPQSPSTPPRPREKICGLDDGVPSSAVDLNNKEKYIQKLNRQERVIEEVKLALKPHYQKRAVTKEEYKDILRRAVPKICHSKNGEINAVKIRYMVEAYIKKAQHARKRHT